MKKLLIVLIGMSIISIISIRAWIYFNPVEPTPEYVEPTIVEEVVVKPSPVAVKVKPKLKQMEKPKPMPKPKPLYKCDKRIYCSQMRSYAEAKYYNDFCPGTRMDGDGDGIPCERQFRR